MEGREGLNKIYRKSWPIDNLFGSSRFELTAAQRGIWNDLLDMAKISRVQPGLIAPAKGSAYSHEWLSNFLNITFEELDGALEVLKRTERISENGSGIEIINWKRYQPEYDRQKPYREAQKAKKVDNPDIDISKEILHRDIEAIESELLMNDISVWRRKKLKEELAALKAKDPDKFVNDQKYGHMVKR